VAEASPMTPFSRSVGAAAMKDPQRRKLTLLIDLEKLNTLNEEGCPACGQSSVRGDRCAGLRLLGGSPAHHP